MAEASAAPNHPDCQPLGAHLVCKVTRSGFVGLLVDTNFHRVESHRLHQRQVASPLRLRRHRPELVPSAGKEYAAPQRITQLHGRAWYTAARCGARNEAWG